MDSIINTFHIDFKIIIAQIFNFVIVFVVLYIYALKPLSKLMKERGEKIAQGVDDAKKNAEVLNNTKLEYDMALASARIEADKIFQQGKKEAETKKASMLEKAKEEVDLMIANGKKNLENEKMKIVEEAKEEITTLSIKIAEKILGAKVNATFDAETLKELKNIK